LALAKRCLGCGQRTTRGSYCTRCWHARRRISTGYAWDKIRKQVHARDRVCVHCGSSDQLQVHHIVAVVDGGSHTLDNLELRCLRCHNDPTLADARTLALPDEQTFGVF
jgi:5-methylcytosine-specific restriction endonuclease McrA